ncbi:hypothetical protein NUKP48_45980 [Klebsiella quasipneumoniae]|nr:hypothetical protein NUKP48_45980 [Klebsiella quasipneumoniae]GKQ16256.1 hypothetical protein NUKP108_47260 [Klebsiella quasipneumoniae]
MPFVTHSPDAPHGKASFIELSHSRRHHAVKEMPVRVILQELHPALLFMPC